MQFKKLLYTLLLIPLSILNIQAQDFYDMNTIQTIEITFADSNWDALLDAQKQGNEEYILAQSVTLNGEVFDSVGVKYKGNSTYNANQAKNPFHIELDTYKDQDYQGYKDIKLSNVAKDPSFLREVLSYYVLRQYMEAPLSNYANVYVNGTLIGLYSNSEAISKTFIDDRFGSNDNTFIKCNPIDGAGPGSNALPSLEYEGQDSTQYYASYEMKSDYGWQDLIDFCDTLNNHNDAVDKVVDIDRVLWMHAFNNALVNLDSYLGTFTQNYYLYKDDNNRFLPVVWDLNESFGKFANTGSGNLNNTTSKQQMNVFLHENDADYPLISKLFENDRYRKMYLAHVKTMIEENFSNGAYKTVGEELQTLIDASVQADQNKFFTYNNFITNLNSSINSGGGPGGGSTVGITELMDGRANYLLNLSSLSAAEPEITDITPASDEPILDEEIIITAAISNADDAYIAYRKNKTSLFTKVSMFDDGMHGDGAAGDGVYGGSIFLDTEKTQYYIYAENDDIGKFSPQRAEFEYHVIEASPAIIELGDLVINEFMASNDVTYADADGEFDDWIELFNKGTENIDLSGYTLSDDMDFPDKWTFPEGSNIGAGEYLIIWADDDSTQAGLHATFKLSASGEDVVLSDNEGTIIDQVSFDDQDTDVSYGRFPNGTGDFGKMNPTPNAENDELSSSNEVFENNASFLVYPNPARELFTISADKTDAYTRIYSLDGALKMSFTFSKMHTIETKNFEKGVYIVIINNEAQKIIIQ